MADTILYGGFLITRDGPVKNAGVRVSGNRIAAVAPNKALAPAPGDAVIDARDRIIAPGFVNGHTHMYGLLSHGIAADAPVTEFSSFLEDFWWPRVENRVDHELARVTSRWSMAELIGTGVTTFVDVLEAPFALPGALEAEREAVECAGLRGYLTFEACQRVSPENALLGLVENADFIRKHNGRDALVQGMMSIHTLFTCDRGFVLRAKELARSLGADIHMHLSESVFEPDWCLAQYGKRPVDVYDEWGFLDGSVFASQCVQLTPKELDTLAARGVRAIHMPLSNCEVGGGVAPVPGMLARGMRVALGSDGYINNFFEVMRGAFLLQKAFLQDPSVMPAKDVFDMATWRGAEALGRREIGRLEAGCLADLITIDLDTPTPVNERNIYDQLVLYRNPEHVSEVMVNGRLLKRSHQLLTVDEAGARAALRERAAAFWTGE